MVCGPRRQKSRLAAQYRQLSADVRDAYQAQLSVARYFAGSSTVRCVRRRAKWFACCSAHCQPGWLGIAILSTILLVLNVGALTVPNNPRIRPSVHEFEYWRLLLPTSTI